MQVYFTIKRGKLQGGFRNVKPEFCVLPLLFLLREIMTLNCHISSLFSLVPRYPFDILEHPLEKCAAIVIELGKR
jgi:hypothetical protein